MDGRDEPGHDVSTIDNRCPDYLVDTLCAGREHHQPVETESYPAGWRHPRQRIDKILVYRVAFTMDTLFVRHRSLKTGTLFGSVGQFPKRICELYPAGVKLEALGNLVTARLWPRQCSKGQRVLT